MPGSKVVRSVDRALEIVELLARSERPQTLAELSHTLDIPKSTLHALLWTLTGRGWIESDEASGRFRIGLHALLVGRSYVESDSLIAMSGAVLDQLAAETGETVHIGRLDGTSIVYLDKRESVHPLRLFSAIGRHLPAFTTALGKSILAELPEDQLEAQLPQPLTRLTPHTITDLGALRADLALTRERGYAVDNEENSEGIKGFAVALRTSEPPHDALSCAIPVARIHDDTEETVVARLREAADRIRGRVSSRAF
ncbi:IclR family transcriptional regulator [Jiangella rhizosphaerae]|uniref:Glycerol operon regulatory protein n=1 Tax=Jiangella rhizosphaerae TaxID=2293569 RepID=A0A418KFY2_9ACTN|nr:IclR family transcriptional regulator [Jiangella rhizosphaerae]RIQ10859.1 IclR family transcriptional regulator [Jiangella rhizosphaerae]